VKGVVFKQRYKPANIKSTPTLNRKHLVYIATRKGAIHNEGCSFGLWGRLPGMMESENINSLAAAKKIMTEVSRNHTVYRAVISVDGDTAKEHGLYERGAWQGLVNRKISVLAEQMNIARKDFRWVASMHYVKGHPHVHVMYWDNSAKVRQEFVPQERFEIIAEKVRAAFGYEIYREEILGFQKEKREIVSEARLELQSLCKEANLAEALNLDHVSNAKLDELQKSFLELASGLPRNGTLKYAYLPVPYKKKLDAFLDEIMKITDFRRLENKYLKLTDEISGLYGNGGEKQAYNRKKAREVLYKGMGNTVLTFLKEFRRELERAAPAEEDELLALVKKTTLPLLTELPSYGELVRALPRERTPMGVILSSPDVREKLSRVDGDIMEDIRVKAMADGYIKAACKKENLHGKERAEFAKAALRDIHKAVRDVVLEQLQEDSGYREQMARDAVLSLLLRLFRSNSRGAGQAQSRLDLLRLRSRELSETARRDRKKQREQAGNWTPEL
jgi:hypothetical protein